MIKNKYVEKKKIMDFTPGYWIYDTNKNIDNENKLLKSKLISKDKTNIMLNSKFKPNDYNVLYFNNNNNNDNNDNYYYNINNQPGRGFGDLNISNNIRNSNSSRYDYKDYKINIEAQQFFDYQFNYLDKNFQNPDNIILPFPRGGDFTRKTVQNIVKKNSKLEFIY